jgi:hypothetical protein
LIHETPWKLQRENIAAGRQTVEIFRSLWQNHCMKIRLFLLSWSLPLLLVLSGCSNKYVLTLNQGSSYVCDGRPTLNKKTGMYKVKLDGKSYLVPSVCVRRIEPASDVDKTDQNTRTVTTVR